MKRSAAGFLGLLAIATWGAACRKGPPPSVSPRLAVLEEIMASKNDNDPRLDSAFNGLSDEDKRLFRERYRSLPLEKRNERGTIVYLLGKNLGSAEDWKFLREVASEPPCLSLADCSKAGGGGPGDEVTLAYPSLVALKQAQRVLEVGITPEAMAVVEAGKRSTVPAVAKLAGVLDRRFGR